MILKAVLETLPNCSEANLYTCECGKDFLAIVARVDDGSITKCPKCTQVEEFAATKERNRVFLEEQKAKAIADDLELYEKVKARDAEKKAKHEERQAILLQNLK